MYSSAATFNVNDGYLEALTRGYRGSLLTQAQYLQLAQADTLDDLKIHLQTTDYAVIFDNDNTPMDTMMLSQRIQEKMVSEFNHVRNQATFPLSRFLDFITYGYMIDNVLTVIQGTLHDRDSLDRILDKCHPLGRFDTMKTITVHTDPAELYRTVLVDTPLAKYFAKCLTAGDLEEMNPMNVESRKFIEIMRGTLFKAYLEDFHSFCKSLGGVTAEVMTAILGFEADRRAINITLNSIGTDLSKDDRLSLYPSCGALYPDGIQRLAEAQDEDAVKRTMDNFPAYRSFFPENADNDKQLEDRFFEHEVAVNRLAFEQQFQYGVFYALMKLKEQEGRNIVWIAECVAQQQKQRIPQCLITIF